MVVTRVRVEQVKKKTAIAKVLCLHIYVLFYIVVCSGKSSPGRGHVTKDVKDVRKQATG